MTQHDGGGKGGAPDNGTPGIIPRRGMFARLRRYFFTGVMVATPISVTIYLVIWFISLVDGLFTPLIPDRYDPDGYLPFSIPGLGLLMAAVLFTLLGALTANFMGRALVTLGERLVGQMPILRNIYNAVKQILGTLVARRAGAFSEVGLIEYPRPGLFCLVFITGHTRGEIPKRLGQEMTSVFLPTTPNPTSGFLLFIPSADIRRLDMSVEQAAKLIISAGLVVPEFPRRAGERGPGEREPGG